MQLGGCASRSSQPCSHSPPTQPIPAAPDWSRAVIVMLRPPDCARIASPGSAIAPAFRIHFSSCKQRQTSGGFAKLWSPKKCSHTGGRSRYTGEQDGCVVGCRAAMLHARKGWPALAQSPPLARVFPGRSDRWVCGPGARMPLGPTGGFSVAPHRTTFGGVAEATVKAAEDGSGQGGPPPHILRLRQGVQGSRRVPVLSAINSCFKMRNGERRGNVRGTSLVRLVCKTSPNKCAVP